MGPDQPHQAARIRREAPDPDRQGQARRGAVLGRCQSAALVLGRQSAGRSRPSKPTASSISAPSRRRTRRTRRRSSRSDSRRAMPVSVDGEKLSPASLLDQAERARQGQRHRPPRSGREPLRRHEVARRLRDAGRHDPAGRASRDGVDHARSRRRASEGRSDAALCRADLQRLLVLARARDAAGADRQEPGIRRRARFGSSSTRAM